MTYNRTVICTSVVLPHKLRLQTETLIRAITGLCFSYISTYFGLTLAISRLQALTQSHEVHNFVNDGLIQIFFYLAIGGQSIQVRQLVFQSYYHVLNRVLLMAVSWDPSWERTCYVPCPRPSIRDKQ